jgi:hypothetical protein
MDSSHGTDTTSDEITTSSTIVKSKPRICWQALAILVFGAFIVIYAAVAPGVQTNRRVFSIVMMLLWAILWALILWITWKDSSNLVVWLLFLIPLSLMIVFFILVIVMNIDSLN